MDPRWVTERGVPMALHPYEADIAVRLDWMCTDQAVVADLDLSCALYDFKVRSLPGFVGTGMLTTHMVSGWVTTAQGEVLEVIDFSK
jgi:hypothetical protein